MTKRTFFSMILALFFATATTLGCASGTEDTGGGEEPQVTVTQEIPDGEQATDGHEIVAGEYAPPPPSGTAEEEWAYIWGAIHEGDMDYIKEKMDSGINVNSTGPEGETMVNIAIWTEQPEVLRFLIERGADPSQEDSHGQTPLEAAFSAESRGVELLQILIGAGVDVNTRTSNQQKPLGAVIEARHMNREDRVRMAEQLVAAGARLSPESEDDYAILSSAAAQGMPRAVEVLLEAGADPTLFDAPDSFRIRAVSKSHTSGDQDSGWEIVRILVDAGADPNSYDQKSGMSMLARAALDGRPNAVAFLLKAGADPNRDPLESVRIVEAGNAEIVSMLLEAGLEPNTSFLEVTLLEVAQGRGHDDIAGLLIGSGATE